MRPAPTRCSISHAGARSPPRTRRSPARRRAAGLLRRKQRLGARRRGQARGGVRRPGSRLRLRALRSPAAATTRRALLALRDEAARAGVRSRRDNGRQRRHLHGQALRLHRARLGPQPRRLVSVPARQAGPPRGLRPGAVAAEPMAPSIGDEFARKRRIMRPLWDVVVLDGMLSPRGYSPALRVRDLQPPPAALRGAVAAPDRARRQRRPARRGDLLCRDAGAAAGGARCAALASLVPIAPFRIARYYVSVPPRCSQGSGTASVTAPARQAGR